MPKTIYEYRGVNSAVYAKVTQDDSEGFVTGEVKDFAGVSEIARTTESSNEAHYYDNTPAVIISSTGADEVAINASAIPLDILADITGQYYDENTGMFVEQERDPGYYAFGYRTQKTDGSEVLVWRLKGSFSIPDSTHQTKDDSTDANGQELTYTGISTTHSFTKTGKPAKAVNVDTSLGLVDTTNFFNAVQTPDTINASGSVAVTGVTLSASEEIVEVNSTVTLTATVQPTNASNQNVTWSSSDDAIATVSNGVVTGVAEGTATITVTTAEGGYTATCEVTVSATS